MPVPLAVAVPSAVAAAAYVDAKTGFSYDWKLMTTLLTNSAKIALRQRRDKLNTYYLLEYHAQSRQFADRTFLWYEGRQWTFKETYDTVLQYATWLKLKYSIGPKEIVAMDFVNSPKFIFLWMALWSLGARPAFINYNLTAKPLLHCIRISTARILLVDDEVRSSFTEETLSELSSSQFRDGRGPVEVAFFTPEMEAEVANTEGVREPDTSRSGAKITDMAILIFTSGTTGMPKAAIVSWSKCTLGPMFATGWMGWTKKDRLYTCMPLYHSSAAVLGVFSALHASSSVAIGHRFSTKSFWKEVRESDSTIIQYVGETCRYLLAAPPQVDSTTGQNIDTKNNVRIAFGNGLRPDVWNRFKERFGVPTIAEFYAATEGTSGSWNLSKNDFTRGAIGKMGWLGQALVGASYVIVEIDWETETPFRDPETGFARRVSPGERGELLYQLDPADINKSYQGYFNNKKASEGKIMRDVFTKGDAYFRSGDVVRVDNEGRCYFSDRIGDTFRWKGENVSTNEVAECLGHHPAVHEANVYGVSLPHHDGRAGCAALELAESPPPAQLLKAISEHVNNTLPRYATPIFLRVTTSMQRTGNNKQQKHVLRQEGVQPDKVGEDKLFWMKGGEYVRFGQKDWEELNGGRVRL
ncbi:MAG: hypothetical protein M1812_006566 [Candelaria pacifica]|nr:MAG: hypothetical protein M1812_006566 [Candelaria pacifica]